MLLPVYGSWLNTHFAALQPNHKHLYVGLADPNHPHTLVFSHQHQASKTPPSELTEAVPLENGVVNMPNQDASQGVATLVLPFDTASALEAPYHAALTFSVEADYLSTAFVFHSPPTEPPRL